MVIQRKISRVGSTIKEEWVWRILTETNRRENLLMKIIDTPLKDVKILEPKVFGDDRGFFLESFRDDWFKESVADVNFVQDNHSKSKQGILRGLHFQTKQTQGKQTTTQRTSHERSRDTWNNSIHDTHSEESQTNKQTHKYTHNKQ